MAEQWAPCGQGFRPLLNLRFRAHPFCIFLCSRHRGLCLTVHQHSRPDRDGGYSTGTTAPTKAAGHAPAPHARPCQRALSTPHHITLHYTTSACTTLHHSTLHHCRGIQQWTGVGTGGCSVCHCVCNAGLIPASLLLLPQVRPYIAQMEGLERECNLLQVETPMFVSAELVDPEDLMVDDEDLGDEVWAQSPDISFFEAESQTWLE